MSTSNTHLVMRKTSQYSHRYPAILDSGIIPHEISNTSLGPGPQAALTGPRDVLDISFGMIPSSNIAKYYTRLRLV